MNNVHPSVGDIIKVLNDQSSNKDYINHKFHVNEVRQTTTDSGEIVYVFKMESFELGKKGWLAMRSDFEIEPNLEHGSYIKIINNPTFLKKGNGYAVKGVKKNDNQPGIVSILIDPKEYNEEYKKDNELWWIASINDYEIIKWITLGQLEKWNQLYPNILMGIPTSKITMLSGTSFTAVQQKKLSYHFTVMSNDPFDENLILHYENDVSIENAPGNNRGERPTFRINKSVPKHRLSEIYNAYTQYGEVIPLEEAYDKL